MLKPQLYKECREYDKKQADIFPDLVGMLVVLIMLFLMIMCGDMVFTHFS